MGNFKPKKSKTNSQSIEEYSVRCLEDIMNQSNQLKTYFSVNDKTSNIDGYIELLEDNCISGKITVQIKSLPRRFYENPNFDCPTSLFGYAENCPTELVFLIAVNRHEKTAFFKNITQDLIQKNKHKKKQSTIRVSFNEDEKIVSQGLNETIVEWKNLYGRLSKLILDSSKIKQENEALTQVLKIHVLPSVDISESYLRKIQQFIDRYNFLLDYDFSTVKKVFFKNVWKVGFGFSKFATDEIAFALYNIYKGKNDLIIKQVDSLAIPNFALARYALHSSENKIIDNPERFALKLISNDIEKMLSGIIFFMSEITAIEYIFDFIEKYNDILETEKNVNVHDLYLLKTKLEKYPRIAQMSCSVLRGNKAINLNTIYDAVIFLLEKKYNIISRLYPRVSEYSFIHNISKAESIKLAYAKFEYLYSRLVSLFDAFVISNFPSFRNKISLFYDCDIIIANINYDEFREGTHDYQIRLYYFKASKKVQHFNKRIITSQHFESNIFKTNNVSSETELINRCWENNSPFYVYNFEFDLVRCENEPDKDFTTNRYIHSSLCNLLKDRINIYFKDYFENEK
ncbi:MAG TPA: hypothetical protein VFC65_06775 [Prolixibacteraceae bacterium]|nr:hypothetical protein [Prolixibacteraceae bacterium]